jgi:hypothetical protein
VVLIHASAGFDPSLLVVLIHIAYGLEPASNNEKEVPDAPLHLLN